MEVTTSEQAELLNAALDALYYQDGIRKPLTSQRLKQVKAYKAKLNEANALMIDGILQRHEKHKRFLEAYEKGCSHPYLYILLGEGHAQYGEGSIDVSEQVLEYYRKAVDGGHPLAYTSIYDFYRYARDAADNDAKQKGYAYITDLEREGITVGTVLEKIGFCYQQGHGCLRDHTQALYYYQRAIDAGYIPAYLSIHRLWRYMTDPASDEVRDNSVLCLLEGEKKGVSWEDDRILQSAIEVLIMAGYTPGPLVLGEYKDRGEMAFHLCHILRHTYKSFRGYHMAGSLYWAKKAGIPRDITKTIAFYEEAERLGLASLVIYAHPIHGLIKVYSDGVDVPKDLDKALGYCLKAAEIATSLPEQQLIRRYATEITTLRLAMNQSTKTNAN